MSKTITVKGIGSVSAAPDKVIISMNLESQDKDYETAVNKASEDIAQLEASLKTAGFKKSALKTQSFNVNTVYDSVRDENGMFRNVFKGYAVYHSLKLEFGLSPKKLASAVSVIGQCPAHPQLSIAFTVSDADPINEELLRSATANARSKAEVLCSAAGRKLGDLLSIDYNWGEHHLYSNTNYAVAEDACAAPAMGKCASIDFTPEDIKLKDSVIFVWEME